MWLWISDRWLCVDMHTKRGSIAGRNRRDFVRDGSYVTPEAVLFKNEVFEYIYANHK